VLTGIIQLAALPLAVRALVIIGVVVIAMTRLVQPALSAAARRWPARHTSGACPKRSDRRGRTVRRRHETLTTRNQPDAARARRDRTRRRDGAAQPQPQALLKSI
jgi:hypothetical protein